MRGKDVRKIGPTYSQGTRGIKTRGRFVEKKQAGSLCAFDTHSHSFLLAS